MSHSQNLRRQQAVSAVSSAKRPLINDNTLPVGLNGLLNGDEPLTAEPLHDAKRQKTSHKDDSAITIQYSHGDICSTTREPEVVELSSAEEPGSDSSGGEEEVARVASNGDNEHLGPGSESEDALNDTTNAGAQETADSGASFGELLLARGAEPTTIDATMDDLDQSSSHAQHQNKRALTVPSPASLGTVLTQALKSNDVDLLESCLQIPNLESIRATIERLHSSLAANLLQKLAERMHKRPGRAGRLMVWVQWTVVAHGGYLASQPAAMRQLHTLYQVVKQRATGLQPLLTLKGKLDMLEAQMQLRRNMKDRAKRMAEDKMEEEPVIYVEGEEDDSEVDGELVNGKHSRNGVDTQVGAEDDEDMANGVDTDADSIEELEAEMEHEGDLSSDLLDDEAEETENDSNELSEDIDYDDVDDDGTALEGSDSDEVEAPVVPVSKKGSSQK